MTTATIAISRDEWLEELRKYNGAEDSGNYVTTESLAERIGCGVGKARRLIKDAIRRGLLEPRQVRSTTMAGTACIVPAYFPVRKAKKN